jgi:hypothetical protein
MRAMLDRDRARTTASFRLFVLRGRAYIEWIAPAFQTGLRPRPDCVDWPVVRADEYQWRTPPSCRRFSDTAATTTCSTSSSLELVSNFSSDHQATHDLEYTSLVNSNGLVCWCVVLPAVFVCTIILIDEQIENYAFW